MRVLDPAPPYSPSQQKKCKINIILFIYLFLASQLWGRGQAYWDKIPSCAETKMGPHGPPTMDQFSGKLRNKTGGWGVIISNKKNAIANLRK